MDHAAKLPRTLRRTFSPVSIFDCTCGAVQCPSRTEKPALSPSDERIVDVQCDCGWEQLDCLESKVPQACPLCGTSFDSEVLVAENPGNVSRCDGCGRDTTARHGLCSVCSSVRRNPIIDLGIQRNAAWSCAWCSAQSKSGARLCDKCEHTQTIVRNSQPSKECLDCGDICEKGRNLRGGLCRTCWSQRRAVERDLELQQEDEDERTGSSFGGSCSPGGFSVEELRSIERRIDREWRTADDFMGPVMHPPRLGSAHYRSPFRDMYGRRVVDTPSPRQVPRGYPARDTRLRSRSTKMVDPREPPA